MAIIFVSPKRKQRMFFLGMAMLLVLFLIIISLIILLPEFLNKTQNIPTEVSSNMPNVTINLNTIDSDVVKNLDIFSNLETEFTYVIQNQSGQQATGNIIAISKDSIQKIFEKRGIKVISLKEANIGRDNPFVSY